MQRRVGRFSPSLSNLQLGRLIAHRGASGYAPENTLSALQSAYNHGVGWVEVDAQVTLDGEVIILHDATLDRTTNGSGLVAKAAATSIRSLDAGSWFSREFAGERVPTLTQAIILCSSLNMKMNIEIKPNDNNEIETGTVVARLVSDIWPRNQPPPLLSSFSDCLLQAAYDIYPDAAQGLICPRIPEESLLDEVARRYFSISVNADSLTHSDVMKVKSKGIVLMAYTVNDSAKAHRLFSWGVDYIFTDYPSKFFFSASLSKSNFRKNRTR